MATREQIYDIETPILNTAALILSGSGIASTPLDMEGENLVTPRVELQYSVGSPTGHACLSGSGASRAAELDAWNCQLRAIVVTDRAWSSGSHQRFVAKCRSLLGDYRKFNEQTGSMQFHHIVKSNNVGAQLNLDGDLGYDLTALVFDQVVYVKPNSW
jgi:hypothetical protein